MPGLDEHDIQGLVVRGYGPLPEAQFLLLEVEPGGAAAAGAYLSTLEVATADAPPDEVAIQIAFTYPGLVALGVPARILATFSREFIEGMDDEIRADSIGDVGDHRPATWEWGAGAAKPHAMLLVYARTPALLAAAIADQRTAMAGGFRVTAVKTTAQVPDGREHFGFRDGISTPIIEELLGSKRPESWTYPFRAGEFVLGYRNEYGAYSESPVVSYRDDVEDCLPLTPDETARDLGRNGTYLVYRELTQHVHAFWRYLAEHSREPGADAAERAVALGAKMVGRWPGGEALARPPDGDGPIDVGNNNFSYRETDEHGLRCPFGAHIRRTNPRDQLHSGRDMSDSVEMVRKHQMLRRGRAFGPPIVPSMDPRDVLALAGDTPDVRRGLHFICLVGHLARQFEFVQRAWVNSPVFGTLFKDGDPLIGVRRPASDRNPTDEFTVPAEPLRRKYKGLGRFTTLVGGAYFFLPGVRALRFLARGPRA